MLPAEPDASGRRKAWADMRDSSNETLGEPSGPSRSGSKPALFVANSFESYCETPEKDLADNVRSTLSRRLAALGRSASDVSMAAEASVPKELPPQRQVPPEHTLPFGSTGSAAAFAAAVAESAEPRGATQHREQTWALPTGAIAGVASAAGSRGALSKPRIAAIRRRRLLGKQTPSALGGAGLQGCSTGGAEELPPSRKRSIEAIADPAPPPPPSRQARGRHPLQGEPATPSRRGGRPPPQASEEDWQRRTEKRQAIIAGVKASEEYFAYTAGGVPAEFGEAAPRTPEATDRGISKRQWEDHVRQWRAALRRYGPERSPQDGDIE